MRVVTYFLFLLFPMVVFALALPAAQTDATEGNAALSYWQAFAVMPELSDVQDEMLTKWNEVPLDKAAAKLIEKTDSALGLLHRGAQMQGCIWGTAMEDGPAVLLPHLSRARQLARAACLRARYRFKEGDQQGALDDIVAAMVLARHTGGEGLLISVLVQDAIEFIAVQAVAPQLLNLSDAQLARLFARQSSLPVRTTISQGIATERQWILSWVRRKFVENENAEVREKALQDLMGKDHPDLNKARKYVSDTDAIRNNVEEIGEYYDEMQRILALPGSELQAAWEELDNRIQTSSNGLARLLLPGLGSAQRAEVGTLVRQAMLRAAIEIARDGDGALARHSDPAGDGPFQMKRMENGFQLTSKLVYKDEPVQMIFGGGK